jgi:hypothetical protein
MRTLAVKWRFNNLLSLLLMVLSTACTNGFQGTSTQSSTQSSIDFGTVVLATTPSSGPVQIATGSTIVVSVAVTTSNAIESYTWYKLNTTTAAYSTYSSGSALLEISNAQTSDSGTYRVGVVVASADSTTTQTYYSSPIEIKVSTSAAASGSTCSATSGTLKLSANVLRTTGISPLLVFFDATATTDSALTGKETAFQDIRYSWNYGDTGASGTGTWAYGSNPNKNSKNTSTGGVGAHLYVTSGSSENYTVTVTATDGTNTASCDLGVTAYDPTSSDGFSGTKTTCVAATTTPIAGSGDCPAGAAVMKQANFGTALSSAFGSGKRVLFHCGDSFSGGYTVATGSTTWQIGAYGGCENTSTNRPIFNVSAGGNAISLNTTPLDDGRITDIDFEGNNGAGLVAITTTSGTVTSNITFYNLYANGLTSSYYISGGTQNGIIQSVMTGETDREGVFWNYAENNCANGSNAANCGQTSPVYDNIDYQAILGNDFNGQGASLSNTWETFRISACRLCVFTDNDFLNASSAGGATFKFHSGNTYNSQATWIGQYAELIEISDNYFGGTSGGQLIELSPQNAQYDERIRTVVFERNLMQGTNGGTEVLASGQNMSIRDNVFNGAGSGVNISARGTAATGCAGCANWPTQYLEVYNNTCYKGGACVEFGGYGAAGNDSIVKNNLTYLSGAIGSGGTGNTISNNSTSTSANPGFTNGSGSFSLITDFKPTANYSGGVSVPNFYDALGISWSPTWSLGAIHP